MTQNEVAILWKDANGWSVKDYKNTLEDLESFAKLVAAKEREACARLCEGGIIKGGEVFAAKIRARGNT